MNDTKPAPKGAPFLINEMLTTFDLEKVFDDLMVKSLNAYHIPKGAEAEQFIFSKLDDFTTNVSAQKNEGTTEELRAVLVGWFEAQNDAIDKELNAEWIKSLEEEETA